MIEQLKEELKKLPVTKTGKGQFSKIFSLEDYINALETVNASVYFIAPIKTNWNYEGGKFIASTDIKCILKYNNETINETITGLGNDPRDLSFALGKAITYAKRYFLAGITGLGEPKDAELENQKITLETLKLAVSEKISEANDEFVEKFKAKYKEKYKVEFDVETSTIDELEKINKIDWNKHKK